MRTNADVWRERWTLWLPALLFLALNLGLLSAYRLVFAGQAKLLSGWLERDGQELRRLEVERARLEELVRSASVNQERIERFYSERLSTESERLTKIIAEVKDLARRAEVEPSAINYPGEEFEEYDLLKRSIVFSVEGTYVGLRRFINFLELSESFLTLEEVRLSEGSDGGPKLRINLKVYTLFALPREAAADETVAERGPVA